MSIVISGTTGIDAGSLPVSNCGNTEVEGNLNLSGVGTRITGDFSNATASNRVAFQTSTLNEKSSMAIIPNGTGVSSNYVVYNSSDMSNASNGYLYCDSSVVGLTSGKTGTGTYLPLVIQTGGSERMRIDTAGNVGIGTSSPAYKLDINNAISRIGDSSGIGFLQFGSSATASSNYHIGDNAGNFIFYQGNYGSGTERMRIDSAGRVTMPYQPSFSAFTSVHWDTDGAMTFDITKKSDPNFNRSRFTAPVSGTYLFSWGGIGLHTAVGGGGTARMNLHINGVSIGGAEARADSSQDYDPASSTFIMYLNTGQYAEIYNSDSRGWYQNYTYFTGHLIG